MAGPIVLAGLDELDELVDDGARLRYAGVLPRNRQAVAAQQNACIQPVAECVEHGVADDASSAATSFEMSSVCSTCCTDSV